MKKIALTLAALITAAAAFVTAPAEAGGKRMKFGGPLGSFHASPFSGGAHHHKAKRRKQLAARKAAQRRAAARKAAHRKAAARKAAARKAAARKAHARKLAARKAAARKAAAAKARKVAQLRKKKTSTKTVNRDWNAPVRASAIAGTNTLKFRNDNEAPAKEEVELEDTTPEIEVETAETETTVEVAELECKRFIPSAGMTITVPCQ